MSRDYKPGARSKVGKRTNPVLTGVVMGIAVSLAVAMVMMFVLKKQTEKVATPGARVMPNETRGVLQPAKPQAVLPPGSTSKTAEKPRFDFYTILPGLEEPISEQDIKLATNSSDASNYYLQAGSFQATGEADNLKAKLALIGIEANVETATIPEKGVWHRVRVGPFSNTTELSKMREILAQNGVRASPVKVYPR